MKKTVFLTTLLASTAWALPGQAQTTATPATPPAGTTVAPDAGAVAEPDVDVSTPGGDMGGEIVVVGRNIPDAVRATPQVVNVLSTADIARTGEGDIAGALQRVTGLSVVGNGFVYVRGLGDRYSSSLLNGSPLPSPEPLRRVVPLDIFPTNVIASALVQKSYSVNYPGEFGGGVVNLTTRAVPQETFLQIGGSISADTVTTSELGYVYDGGRYDWTGFDSGERDVPGFVNGAGADGTSLTPAQLTQMSNAPTTLLQENAQLPANYSGELSFGTAKDLGGTRIGLIAAAGFSNTWRTRDATQQVTDSPDAILLRDFHTVLTDNRAILNGLLGLGAEFGENRIRFTNLYVHDTLKQARLSRGSTANIGTLPNGVDPFITQNTNWFERQLIDSQAVGEFKLGDVSLDLRGAYANTQRNAPYERAFTYQYNEGLERYTNNLSGLQSASVAFSELDEDLWSGQANVSWKIPAAREIVLSAGYAYNDTDRDSTRYTFQYSAANNGALDPVISQLRPDYLLSDYTVLTNGIYLRNTSTGQGAAAYSASLRVHAGYAQAEAEVLDGLRGTLGVRYEDAVEEVLPSGGAAGTRLANDYWLPAATITWNFAEDMQLRLHASKTLARPQFRELAPQLYQDFESDRLFFGNAFLKDSQLYNGEVRFEWYFARDQRLSLAGFYKKIDDPIEAVAFFPAGTDTLQTGFANAPSARLFGGEVEFQKYVPLAGLGGDFFATRRLVLIANYTYTDSKIKADDSLIASPLQSGTEPVLRPANVLFQDGAPLVGQSDHLVNLQFGIEDTERLSQLTVLFNYASDRVTNRGPVGGGGGVRLPDLVERPGIRLDLVGRQGIVVAGKTIELKAEARNLTGTRYRESQTFSEGQRVDINSYRLGRIFSLGASITF
ncbi:TonB-dependent receptor domain-containing protein [Sphingomonas desiccabilis]|uniref:TonB-dependent receptor n=1 Tax=Sphingomonas desiccabilis TaxID=429134 RepID=A0A4Q2J052_9SPHN|nr:TonB-dependent receptor [Sphingomonas desiccabilis]MBB3909945.1 outer membrane receptor protein involved in Fe transport [Sphingomonas desiccabilis]RXZ34612.1 TonB-dependent receptor [Sphingomonas desiccabilis]